MSELADIEPEKYMQRGTDNPVKHSKTMNQYKSVSSCTKQKPKIRPKHMTGF